MKTARNCLFCVNLYLECEVIKRLRRLAELYAHLMNYDLSYENYEHLTFWPESLLEFAQQKQNLNNIKKT